ncbi:hypothetical protein GC209_14460 [bacterium]|nr:hypothetical protein [bacterium]
MTEPDPLAEFVAGLPEPAPWGQRVVPRVIWLFWHSGLDTAPDLVRQSLETWRQFNPDHEIRLLTFAEVEEVLDLDLTGVFAEMTVDLGWAGKSDLIRLLLLARHGGIWADATAFCLRPLSSWLPAETQDNGFFCFRKPADLNAHELVSWFIAACPGHPLVTRTIRRARTFLFKPRAARLSILPEATIWKEFKISPGDRPGIGLLDKCEATFGATSYFWLFYLFRAVLENSPRERTALRAKRNEHAQTHHTADRFLSALVSKQTYRKFDEEICADRIRRLFDGMRVRTDFYKAPPD